MTLQNDDFPHPEYMQCSSCGRLIATAHANSTGRCVDCAGKPRAAVEAAEPLPADQPRTGDDIPAAVETESDVAADDDK